ncbi:hypothetical protein BGW38_006083 [Lunasporangiospora selenospora]|uniref:Transmembrane protein n=1 Tax=Lunasporangiospora selenospora TaxID=979761 RepID=A0A9P6KAH5_9FUNG|nr:hypothetical protein BGW38_006083 [Lunasporangiospora selenospora]
MADNNDPGKGNPWSDHSSSSSSKSPYRPPTNLDDESNLRQLDRLAGSIPLAPSAGPTAAPSAPPTPILVNSTVTSSADHTPILQSPHHPHQGAVYQARPPGAASSSSSPIPPATNLPEHTDREHVLYDDAPPSYEAVITKDIPQIHDNYDHIRGPVPARGQELKTRIPSESISHNGAGPSNGRSVTVGNGGASSSSSSSPYHHQNGAGDSHYGSFLQTNTSSQSTRALGLRGEIALGEDDEEPIPSDMERLLGSDAGPVDGFPRRSDAMAPHGDGQSNDQSHGPDRESDDEDEGDHSCWTVAGDGQAWLAVFFHMFVLLPWTLFCYVWTLTVVLVAFTTLIIPPLGYLCVIPAITSWRALARVDLVMSAAMVSDRVRQKYRYHTSSVYIERDPGPEWTRPQIFGYEIPLPGFIEQRSRARHQRQRRLRNLWHRSAKHLRVMSTDHHSIKSLFYFLVWKMMFAIPVFIVIVVLFCLTLPFMICLLPTLLVVSKAFMNWQYRWAVCWLSEKPTPIVL